MAPIKWNRIFEKIQNKSGKEKITIVVLTGILLLVISLPTGSKSGQTETNENTQTRQTGLSESAKSYETVLEEKLEKALKKVGGRRSQCSHHIKKYIRKNYCGGFGLQ